MDARSKGVLLYINLNDCRKLSLRHCGFLSFSAVSQALQLSCLNFFQITSKL